MICLEIFVNGERRTVAGAMTADAISAEIALYPGAQHTWLRVDGEVMPEGQPSADAEWLSQQLTIGDRVEVRLVEMDIPTAPVLTRTEPSADASDSIPFVCAFCNKDPTQTKGMLSSRKASICQDCVRYLYQVISEDDDNSAD
jgi:hypothetical protein